jgi:beta-carotene 3-hydroxylase
VALFAVPALGWVPDLLWVGVGVSAYGAIYLFVHDLYIHRRAPVPFPRLRYLEWLRSSHRAHHHTGGEPYGMLLPLVRSAPPSRRERRDPLDRSTRAGRAAITR